MQPGFTRRDFLTASIAASLPLAARGYAGAAPTTGKKSPAARSKAAGSPTADPAGLTLYQLGPQIWIRWNNQLVTSYRAHGSQKYPYFYPLSGPLSGLSVTAETVLPYPHHRSCYFACDKLNEANFWQEGYEHGQIVSAGPSIGNTTTNSVEILDGCEWRKPGGPVLMRDRRRLSVHIPDVRCRFIDWDIEWIAVTDVVVKKNNHSLFAVRAAPELAPAGGGRLVNAGGDSAEQGTFGRKSAWCDFSGRRTALPGEMVEGIAILDHPQNPWSPAPWFTRDYGFMSPTPFNWIEKPWELAAGKSVRLRYRVVIHAGDAREAGLDAIHREWSARA